MLAAGYVGIIVTDEIAEFILISSFYRREEVV